MIAPILSRIILFSSAALTLLSAQMDSTGHRLLRDRKFAEAESFFAAAVTKDGNDAESRYYLAMSKMMMQNLDDAEDEVDEAIEINGNAAKYHLLRGQILGQQAMTANVLSQGMLAPRIKNAFLKASQLDPSNVESRQALYNYYIMAPGIMGGSEEKALEQATAVVKLDPFRGHLMMANFYSRIKKDTSAAEQQIKKAIAAEPERGGGYKQLGYLYMNQRRFADAYAQMQRYIAVEPKNPDSHDSYGDVLKAEKKYDQAIEKYHVALSVDKNFGASIYSLAECYELKGQKQKAKETFQWFLSVEPNGRRADAAQKKIKEL